MSVVVTTSDGIAYEYDQSTLAQLTDSDLETPITCAHLNNQMIYDGDNDRWCSSDVGDPAAIDALNYATAEGSADDLVRVYTFNQRLYLFGEETIEPWYNSGVGTPPFDRVEGGLISVGLGARYSVANNTGLMYFLADDFKVYRIGSSIEMVSTVAVTNEFEQYTMISDAIGTCFTFQAQNFYHLTFPTEDKTWLFSELTGWTQLSRSGSTGRDLINSHAFIFNKNLVADYRNSNIYELDLNAFTENGNVITRRRATGNIHGGLFGKDGKWLEMNRFELIMETGVGLSTGQGSDPQIMLDISDDGGRTFGTEIRATVGKLSEYQWKVEWFALGGFYTRIMRVSMSRSYSVDDLLSRRRY